MDISTITDINQLKAMAYDQMVTLDQVQRNLSVINARIAEIQQQEPKQPAEYK